MNLIVLSPNVAPNYHHFYEALRALGAKVLAIGDEPFDQLSSHLTGSLEEYYKVENMCNYEELVRAVGYFTHRYGRINAIENFTPHLLLTEARLRSDFNVAGINQATVTAYATYSSLRKIFKRARVNPAYSERVTTLEETRQYINEVNYPVLIRPDSVFSRESCQVIDNETALNSFWTDKTTEAFVLKPYTPAPCISLDGLVDNRGQIVFCASHIIHAAEPNNLFIYSEREIPADLEKAGHKIILSGNLTKRFFHICFYRNTKNKLLAENLNLFPSNNAMVDMFNFANDINMYQEWANILTDKPFTAEYKRPYHCAYIHTAAHTTPEEKYHPLIVAQHALSIQSSSHVMDTTAYIARSANLNEILELNRSLQI
ncbi:hypothetical protein P22_1628 [Propionispora sp. 2/2-37]|uniref:hypothetical protein n=1 Tax=Propionispora sp. 2/2-37 TaxID=1677858 RepID=UPI0006BB8096|nr:hypothetical protein [Propionispora sp. 2/2-37]CUH95557.1 hypothetical protein P22_1628 [Propionispora sp. 2/2-37]